MIQLNIKAKPYNVCEELLGSDAFFKLHRVRLIGSVHHNPGKDNKGVDMLGYYLPTQYYNTRKALMAVGWWPDGGYAAFDVYRKEEQPHSLAVTCDKGAYIRMCAAQEVLKLLNKNGGITKELGYSIVDILVEHKVVADDGVLLQQDKKWMHEFPNEGQDAPAEAMGLNAGIAPKKWTPGKSIYGKAIAVNPAVHEQLAAVGGLNAAIKGWANEAAPVNPAENIWHDAPIEDDME